MGDFLCSRYKLSRFTMHALSHIMARGKHHPLTIHTLSSLLSFTGIRRQNLRLVRFSAVFAGGFTAVGLKQAGKML